MWSGSLGWAGSKMNGKTEVRLGDFDKQHLH